MNVPQSDRKQHPTLSLSSALPLPFNRRPSAGSRLGSLDAALERLFAQPLGEQSLLASPATCDPDHNAGTSRRIAIIGDETSEDRGVQSVVEAGSDASSQSAGTSAEAGFKPDSRPDSDAGVTPVAGAPDAQSDKTDADSADCDQIVSDADAAERRAFPRRDSGSTVSIHRPRDQAAMSGQETSWLHHASRLKGSLMDVSMSGAALRMAEPLDQGEIILLRLSNRRFDVSVDRKATVLRCLPDGEGSWKIVCQYDSKLTFEQVDVLGKGLFISRLV